MSTSFESQTFSLPGGADLAVAWQRTSTKQADDLLSHLNERQQKRARSMRQRRRFEEYVLTRYLLVQLGTPNRECRSISHCARWVAVASVKSGKVGLDVECRLPRHREAVAERLGWNSDQPGAHLQAWTLWEAWRKLEGGSVLDEPEATYAGALGRAADLLQEPQVLEGAWWWSLELGDACLSVCARDN